MSVRLGLVLKAKESLSLSPLKLKESEMSVVKPNKPLSEEDASLITVCFGEIHQFKIKENDTMLSLLEFSCRRFNLLTDQYEIQDLNYQTYPKTTTVVDYQKSSGSAIVRLVKKTVGRQDSNQGKVIGHFGPAQQQQVTPIKEQQGGANNLFRPNQVSPMNKGGVFQGFNF